MDSGTAFSATVGIGGRLLRRDLGDGGGRCSCLMKGLPLKYGVGGGETVLGGWSAMGNGVVAMLGANLPLLRMQFSLQKLSGCGKQMGSRTTYSRTLIEEWSMSVLWRSIWARSSVTSF